MLNRKAFYTYMDNKYTYTYVCNEGYSRTQKFLYGAKNAAKNAINLQCCFFSVFRKVGVVFLSLLCEGFSKKKKQ